MKDFSTNFTVRTDLASETREYWKQKNKGEPDGIFYESREISGILVERMKILDERGSKISEKPVGEYVTVNIGKVWTYDIEKFNVTLQVLSKCISQFIKSDGLCLLAGLGNSHITADAVGPFTADNFIVTRHLKNADAKMFESLNMRETACIVPGVLGNTGIEASDIIKSAVDFIKPDFVIVIDALCSRKLSRLATTVQITDTGICPGSGIYNKRKALNKETLGIPVIAIGIPTVVEAQTIAYDLIFNDENEVDEFSKEVSKRLSENPKGFFVTPKETDHIIKDTSKLIGYAVNMALHKGLTKEEVDEFLS